MLYQQGDVLIESIDCIPVKAKKIEVKKGKYILAKGEATGHAHAVNTLVTRIISRNQKISKKKIKSPIAFYELNDEVEEDSFSRTDGHGNHNQEILYCEALSPFTVTHEEHNEITIPPGIYRIRRVREYFHFDEDVRFVAD